MSSKKKTRTEQVITVVHALAWLAFIALTLEAGAILVSFGISFFNPEGAKNLYKGLNLFSLREFSFLHYSLFAFLMVALASLKALMIYLLMQTLVKVKLANPFQAEIAWMVERLSYVLLTAGIVVLLMKAHAKWLLKVTGEEYVDPVFGEFLFVAGLVFIVSQIFKRGVEIQAENELTV